MSNQKVAENLEINQIDYQMAVNLSMSEGEGIWARSNFMLLANSIAIAAISLALTSDKELPILTEGLPIFGFTLCIIWILLVERGFNYQKYFILSARELEARIPNSAQIFTRGETFSKGEKVMFEMSDGCIPHRMKYFGRLLAVKNNTYLIIGAFMVIYLFFYLI